MLCFAWKKSLIKALATAESNAFFKIELVIFFTRLNGYAPIMRNGRAAHECSLMSMWGLSIFLRLHKSFNA